MALISFGKEVFRKPVFKSQHRFMAYQRLFNHKPKIRNSTIKLYRERLKALSGTLGIQGHPGLETFVPQFNSSHLSKELQQFVTEVPEAEKPVHVVRLLIKGIGYRARWEKQKNIAGDEVLQMFLRLGYSHEVVVDVPDNVSVEEGNMKNSLSYWTWVSEKVSTTDCQEIILRSKDLLAVTQFAATVRRLRKTDPYKLKGIFVDVNNGQRRTNIVRKKGRSGAKG